MAKSSLNASLILELAGVFLLTAGAVHKFSGSRRRADGLIETSTSSVRMNEIISLQLSFLHFLHLNERQASETWEFALFFCASSVSSQLYELEHDLLSGPDLKKWTFEIEALYQLRNFWLKDPIDALRNGILDSWDIELSILKSRDVYNRFIASEKS